MSRTYNCLFSTKFHSNLNFGFKNFWIYTNLKFWTDCKKNTKLEVNNKAAANWYSVEKCCSLFSMWKFLLISEVKAHLNFWTPVLRIWLKICVFPSTVNLSRDGLIESETKTIRLNHYFLNSLLLFLTLNRLILIVCTSRVKNFLDFCSSQSMCSWSIGPMKNITNSAIINPTVALDTKLKCNGILNKP